MSSYPRGRLRLGRGQIQEQTFALVLEALRVRRGVARPQGFVGVLRALKTRIRTQAPAGRQSALGLARKRGPWFLVGLGSDRSLLDSCRGRVSGVSGGRGWVGTLGCRGTVVKVAERDGLRRTKLARVLGVKAELRHRSRNVPSDCLLDMLRAWS